MQPTKIHSDIFQRIQSQDISIYFIWFRILEKRIFFVLMCAFLWFPFSCHQKKRCFFCSLAFIHISCATNFINLPLLEEGRVCNVVVDYLNYAFCKKKRICVYIIQTCLFICIIIFQIFLLLRILKREHFRHCKNLLSVLKDVQNECLA